MCCSIWCSIRRLLQILWWLLISKEMILSYIKRKSHKDHWILEESYPSNCIKIQPQFEDIRKAHPLGNKSRYLFVESLLSLFYNFVMWILWVVHIHSLCVWFFYQVWELWLKNAKSASVFCENVCVNWRNRSRERSLQNWWELRHDGISCCN